MKKSIYLFAGLLLMLCSVQSYGQSSTADFFNGSWNLLIKGTPNGDIKMTFNFQKGADTLAGVVLDSTGVQIAKMDKIEIKDTLVTAYFSTMGYDVNVALTKKDEDHISGSLMQMFDVDGERVKKVLSK